MTSALQSLNLLRDGESSGGGSGSSGDGVGGVLLPNAIVFKRLQQAAKRVRERLASALERANGEPAALDSDQYKVCIWSASLYPIFFINEHMGSM